MINERATSKKQAYLDSLLHMAGTKGELNRVKRLELIGLARQSPGILDEALDHVPLVADAKSDRYLAGVFNSAFILGCSSDVPGMHESARDFVANNLSKIDALFQDTTAYPRALQCCMRILKHVGSELEEPKRLVAFNFILKHFKDGLQSLPDVIGVVDFEIEIGTSYAYALEDILRYGTEEQKKQARELLTNNLRLPDILSYPRIVADKVLRDLFFSFPLGDPETGKVIADVLGKYGLDPGEMTKAWEMSTNDKEKTQCYLDNLIAIRDLEIIQPGICQFLYSVYGIRDFTRYPQSLLVRQYNNEENLDIPYGIAIYSRSDHNGAYYCHKDGLWELNEQLTQGDSLMRIAECASANEFYKLLERLNDKYGQKHKISFVIIAAHGYIDGVLLGLDNYLESIDLTPVGQFFECDATLIFISCDTGQEGGIAHSVSKNLRVKTIAPDDKTSLKKIWVVFNGSRKPSVHRVEYWKHEVSRTYIDGVLCK